MKDRKIAVRWAKERVVLWEIRRKVGGKDKCNESPCLPCISYQYRLCISKRLATRTLVPGSQ